MTRTSTGTNVRSRSNTHRQQPAQSGSAPLAIDPIRVIREHIGALLGSVNVGLIAGGGVLLVWNYAAPVYRGDVVFELAGELVTSDEASARENRGEETVARLAQTEAQKSISEEVLEKVLKNRDVQKTAWAMSFMDEQGNFLIDEAFIELEDEVAAGHVRNTQFFKIYWAAKSASDIPVVLNQIAKTYLANRVTARALTLNSVRGVFATQKETLKDEIVLAQAEIDELIKMYHITSLNMGTTALAKDLDDITLKLNETKQDLELSRTREQQVESKLLGRLEPSQDDMLDAEMDPIVIQASQSIQMLKVELAHSREKFSSEHRGVQDYKQRVSAAERIKEERVDEVVQRNLSSSLKLLKDSIESLSGLELSLENEIESMGVRLEEFTGYFQILTQKQAVVERLQIRLDKLEQTQLEIQAMKDRDDAEKVILVQAASTPRKKSWPIWYLVIPATSMLVFGLTLGTIFLRELMDKRLKYATDVFNLPGGRLIGVVPDISDDPTDASRVEMVVRDHPASVVSESFRQCCAGVMQSLEASGAKSIMICSGLPESGTTSVSLNLAITAIHSGRKVAVVDANFRRPRISELMGLDPSEAGLGEVLSEEASLSSVTKTTQDGLIVIPAGSPEYRIYERLNTSRFSAMLDELSSSVDLVIIDVPPLVVAGEGIAIASRVDASILVARAYSEQKGLVIRLIRQLTSQPSEFLEIILSRPRTTAGGYFKKNFAAMANYTPTHTESDDS